MGYESDLRAHYKAVHERLNREPQPPAPEPPEPPPPPPLPRPPPVFYLTATTGPLATVRLLLKAASAAFNVDLADLYSPRRQQPQTLYRQIVMYLAAERGVTPSRIGFFFRRDHSTVLHARRLVGRRIETDPQLREQISLLLSYVTLDEPGSPI